LGTLVSIVKQVIKIGIASLSLVFIGLMFYKTIPYFEFQYAKYFLSTKSDKTLNSAVFNTAFYTHISTAFLVILIGVFQFNSYIINQKAALHRFLGKVYVLILLGLAAPSGLILGVFANGGLVSKVGFILQSIVWFLYTLLAYLEIKKGNLQKHLDFMIKSYAITLAALSLRSESYLISSFFDTKPMETYTTVVWLSWVGNLFIAEILLYFKVYSINK
jgi:uncharacterized membrane protein